MNNSAKSVVYQQQKTLNDQLGKLISRDPRVLFGYFLRQSIDLVVLCRPMKLQSSNDYFGDVILDLRKAIAITTIIETIDRKGIVMKIDLSRVRLILFILGLIFN